MAVSEIERLKSIVEKLRSEDGCPWDKAQTHVSLKPGCIEEAAEVIGGNRGCGQSEGGAWRSFAADYVPRSDGGGRRSFHFR